MTKKIFSIALAILAVMLTSGVASVAIAQTPSPVAGSQATTAVKYTTAQQACIKVAQDKRSAAVKAATDTLNSTTKTALQTRQAAMKAATDTLNAATKSALKAEQDAITAAQKSTDIKARVELMKEAFNAYNNNATVKKAKVPYTAELKSANDAYNNDVAVKQAQPAYAKAVKAANDQFQTNQKACLSPAPDGLFQKMGNSIKGFFSSLGKLFSGKK